MKELGAKIFSKQNIIYIYIFISLFCAYLLFPNYFELNIYPIQKEPYAWISLDPSWTIGLNYLKQKSLTWGNDLVFTYGPLGQLCTRVGWGENRFLFLFFDLFVFYNWFRIFYKSLSNSKNIILTILMIVFVVVVFPDWIGIANAFILLLFQIFWLRDNIENQSKESYIILSIISVLMLFVKFNTGLFVLPLYYVLLIYNRFNKKITLNYFLLFLLLPILLIFGLLLVFKISPLEYIKSALEIVSGYNSVMYLENQIPNSLTYVKYIGILLIFALIVNLYLNKKLKNIEKLFVLGISVLSFFLIYKQAFVRADIGHINEFFVYIFLLIFVVSDLHIYVKNYITSIALLGAICMSIYFLNTNKEKVFYLTEKISKKEYFNGFVNFSNASGLHINEGYSKLPDSFLNKIGNNTVDVYPWNIQMLIENKLNYHNRPIIQSYSCYTKSLEQKNFQHYNSESAPKYVIYEYESIDYRYPMFDESLVHLALKKNYTIVDSGIFDERKIILLEKKVDFVPVKLIKTNEYAMLLNSPLIPKENIYYEIEMYHNINGKIQSVLKNSPEIKIEMQIEKGSKVEYKTSDKLLQSGIFSNVFIENTNSFSSFIKKDKNLPIIKYYNFKPYDTKMFKDKIKITEYKITQ